MSGQIAIAWIKAQSGKNGNPVMIPIPGATTEERIKENMKAVELSEEDMVEIQSILNRVIITGDRYGGPGAYLVNG